MTDEVRNHLARLEQALQAAKPILGRYDYADDYRTVTLIGFISQVIEHQESMLLLVQQGNLGSAFALARPVLEATYRGLWIDRCAADPEVQKFIGNDKIDVPFGDMAKAIDAKYQTNDAFEKLKNRSWALLNSLTHTGMHQIKRRFTGHDAKPSYTDGQIVEATSLATTCALILIAQFFDTRGYKAESAEIFALFDSSKPPSQQAPQP